MAAVIIIAVGLATAAAVYVRAGRTDAGEGSYRIVGGQVFSNDDSSSADRESERLGGKALVRTAEFNRWLASLWHGQRLAWTLAALSILTAGVCYYIAGLMDEAAQDAAVPDPADSASATAESPRD